MKLTIIIIFLALAAKACEEPDIQPEKVGPPRLDRVDTARKNKPDTVKLNIP
ncbi:MAG: hypothetical protein QHC79_09655 [Pseudosphingobacterium sp.]|nr:hypothetical protein [Pseudosphingobacterium sp.]